MSRQAWISAGKVSAAVAALALLLGVDFQGQAQQRSDMADVRAEMRSGFSEVNARFSEVNGRFSEVNARFSEVNARFDSIDRDLSNLRERVARIEGHLALAANARSQANSTP